MKKLICLALIFAMLLCGCSRWSVEIVDPTKPVEGDSELVISEDETEEPEEQTGNLSSDIAAEEKKTESEPNEKPKILDIKEIIAETLKERHEFDFESIVSSSSNGKRIYFVAGGYPEDSGHHHLADYIEMLFSVNYDGTGLEGPYVIKEAMTNRYSIVFDNYGNAYTLQNNIPLYSAEETEPLEYLLVNAKTGEEHKIVDEKDIDGEVYNSVTGQWNSDYTTVDSVICADDGNWYISMSNNDGNKAKVIVLNSEFEEINRFEDKKIGGLLKTTGGKIIHLTETEASFFNIENLEQTGNVLKLPEEWIYFIGSGNDVYDFVCVTEQQVLGFNIETGENEIIAESFDSENGFVFVRGVYVSEEGNITIL